MSEKIINTFQQRRQLQQDMDALADCRNENELTKAVQQLAHTYPHDLLLNTLIKYLDTNSSQLRGGLGHLATLLPPEEAVPTLRNIVANRQKSAQIRVTAASILERYIGEELPSGLVADLDGSNEAAMQSLYEVISEAEFNRAVLLEYIEQMKAAGPDIPFMVMDLMEKLIPAERVSLLRILIQDEQANVAREALRRLNWLATEDEEPMAVAALHGLQFTLPPETAEPISRTLRKLQFAGRRHVVAPRENWRALLSPADATASQSVWLLWMDSTLPDANMLLGFAINQQRGILQVFGNEAIEREMLPKMKGMGEIVPLVLDEGSPVELLEIPFDYGRWLIQSALKCHWDEQTPEPLPEEYKLYNDWVWQFDAPEVDAELMAYFDRDNDAIQDGESVDLTLLDSTSEALLEHSVMAQSWLLYNQMFLQGFDLKQDDLVTWPSAVIIQAVLQEIARWPHHGQLVATVEEALRAQAAWFHIADEPEQAQRAYLLARWMRHLPVTQNPMLARMVAMGIGVAQDG